MKIAVINTVGIEGSTGKIATKLAQRYTTLGHECRVFHGRGKKCDDDIHVKHGCYFDNVLHYLLARITGKEGYYSTFFTKKIIRDVIAFNPDRLIILNLHGHYLNIPLFINEISKLFIHIDWLMCDDYPFTARCEYATGCSRYQNRCSGCSRYMNVDSQYKDKEQYYSRIKDKTVFSSVRYIVDRAKKSSLLHDAKFDYKNTGIDTVFYHPVDSSSFREKYGIPKDKIVLLDVAPFSNKRKGVDLFVQAAKLLNDDERYVFVNVGYDGKQSLHLSNFIEIPYVNNQEELREIYSSADRYVCTSIDDALPNACVEAMSCGTPISAFNTSGMPGLAEPPVLTLVDEITAKGLADSIRLTGQKDDFIVDRCRKEAINNYEFSNYADSILNT